MMLRLFKRKQRIFETSSFFKRMFSMISLGTMLALSIFLLFQEDTIPTNSAAFRKTGWNVLLLLMLWFGISYLDKNLHISKYDRYFSYFFSVVLITYLYCMVFVNYNYVPKDWYSFKYLLYWLPAIIGIDVVWKFVLSWTEYRTRPFYSRELFWRGVSGLFLGALIWMAFWNLETYFIDKKTYNYMSVVNVINWFLGFWFIVALLFINFKIYISWRRYSTAENKIVHNIMIINSFIKITSFFVWSLSVLSFSKISYYEFTYVIIYLCLILFIITALFFKLYLRKNNLLIMCLMISLLIMSSISFIFIRLLNANDNFIYIFSVSFILFCNFVIIISGLKLSYLFHFFNNKLAYLLMLNAFLVWAFAKIDIDFDIFNIRNLLPAAKLAYISVVAMIPLLSISKSTIIININISKLYSIKLKNKKIKVKKGG